MPTPVALAMVFGPPMVVGGILGWLVFGAPVTGAVMAAAGTGALMLWYGAG